MEAITACARVRVFATMKAGNLELVNNYRLATINYTVKSNTGWLVFRKAITSYKSVLNQNYDYQSRK
jgi:hypothetical protein